MLLLSRRRPALGTHGHPSAAPCTPCTSSAHAHTATATSPATASVATTRAAAACAAKLVARAVAVDHYCATARAATARLEAAPRRSHLLTMLEKDSNMLVLPPSVKRVLQLIFDGHGFLSRSGAVRFSVRSPHTIKDHNATRNARDPIFFIGTDKHLYLEKAVQIGGEDSLSAHMYAGVIVTETDPAEMPAHVQSDKDYLPLACIG
jgi:hypothetical protein